MSNLKYAVEGILFAVGDSVKAGLLAGILNVDIDEIENAVNELREEYNATHRGITIIDIDEGYQLCSRPEYYAYIQEVLGEQRKQALSNAAMEILAIVAYKQPVTRAGVEYVRGVNSDSGMNRLVERGLIEECGRLNAPGKPILYRTTQNFLRCFGLSTIHDLPQVDLSSLNAFAPQAAIDELTQALEGDAIESQNVIPGQVTLNEVEVNTILEENAIKDGE